MKNYIDSPSKKQSKRPTTVSDLDILWALRDIPKNVLNSAQKGILSMFLACIGNKGFCFYNMKQLENLLGCSECTLRRQLHQLEDAGFIKIERPAKYNRGTSNEYRLNYELILSTADYFRAQK